MTKVKKENETLPIIQPEKLDKIIRQHVYGAMGAGFVPLPIIDFVAFTAIQLNMVRKLAQEFNVPFKKDSVKNILTTMLGGAIPAAISGPLAASTAKFIPAIGTTAGVITMPITSGASTYAIGQIFVKHFESNGTFLALNTDKVKEYYDKMLKKGEDVAKDIQKEKGTKK